MPLLSVNIKKAENIEMLFSQLILNGMSLLSYLTSSLLNHFYSWDEGTVKNISIIGYNQLTVVS